MLRAGTIASRDWFPSARALGFEAMAGTAYRFSSWNTIYRTLVGALEPERYRLGREGYLGFLLGAQSIPDLLRRRRALDALLQADLEVLARLRTHSLAAKAARDELAGVRDEVARASAEEADKRATLEARALQQRRLLAAAQEDRAMHEQAVRELEQAAGALTGELRALQQQPAAVGPIDEPIAKFRGKLPFPLETGRIEAHFGRSVDDRFGTVTMRRGIDVRGKGGALGVVPRLRESAHHRPRRRIFFPDGPSRNSRARER